MLKMMLSMIACLLLVAGCNTIHGAGEDVQQTGEAVDRAVP